MKISLVFGVLLAALVATGARSVRADEKNLAQAVAKAPIVTWKESESQKLLFTSDDILFFDWDKQYFLLKDVAFSNYIDWTEGPGSAREISVEDKEGLIYQARYISGNSSIGHSEPTYYPRLESCFGVDSHSIIYISDGSANYKSSLGSNHSRDSRLPKDRRDSARLRAGLQAAGVLKPEEKNSRPDEAVQKESRYQWKKSRLDVNVGVECFTATFGRGQQPRADFLFVPNAELQKQTDALAIEIRFVANNGLFRSDTRVEAISPTVIADRVYRCQLPPWKPVAGSQPNITSDRGRVTFSLLFQKRVNGKLIPSRRVEFDGFDVTTRPLL